MKLNYFKCDKCGKIGEDFIFLDLSEFIDLEKSYDLCKDCFDKYKVFMEEATKNWITSDPVAAVLDDMEPEDEQQEENRAVTVALGIASTIAAPILAAKETRVNAFKRGRWSAEEVKYLRQHYMHETVTQISEHLKRKPELVRNKIHQLGIKKRGDKNV